VDGYGLVTLVEGLAARWAEAHPARGGHALLVEAALPEPTRVGSNGSRLWVAPVDAPEKLRGVEARALLATHARAPVTLVRDATPWIFDAWASGPLADRYHPLATAAERTEVRAWIDEALAAAPPRSDGGCPICDGPRVRERYLPIVGAPTFHDHGSRGWCVKRCALCGAVYLWQAGYDYLVNGATEDEQSLTRLDEAQARDWLAQVDAALATGRTP